MNIVFMMGGRANEQENSPPAYLSEVNGKLLLEERIEACATLPDKRFTFIVNKEDNARFHIGDIINVLLPEARVIVPQRPTGGAACTVLLASEHIDTDEPLIILAVNDFITAPYADVLSFFKNAEADAGIAVFSSVHPRYSFARENADGKVMEVAEKRPISRNAIASFYYFAQGRGFIAAAKDMIRKDAHVDGRFYIAPALNEFILQHKNIAMWRLSPGEFHSVKDAEQLAQYQRQAYEESREKA